MTIFGGLERCLFFRRLVVNKKPTPTACGLFGGHGWPRASLHEGRGLIVGGLLVVLVENGPGCPVNRPPSSPRRHHLGWELSLRGLTRLLPVDGAVVFEHGIVQIGVVPSTNAPLEASPRTRGVRVPHGTVSVGQLGRRRIVSIT